jgi:hypothetical protein
MSLLLVSTVDKTIVVPKEKSSFPNEERLEYHFKAGEPQEVEDYVAEVFSKSYPNIYSIVKTTAKVQAPLPGEKESARPEAKVQFDPVGYLTNNPAATEEELKTLKQSELLALCETLELKNVASNTGVPKLAAKIAQELAVKNEAEKIKE